jgi:predicted aspartyl protease
MPSVLTGTVTDDGVPQILLAVAGQPWPAIIDTGFNGELELPDHLRHAVNARFIGRIPVALGGGQHIEEDVYLVDFPFDGETLLAEATFVPGQEILLGTHLLRQYRLAIDFPARTVQVERVA